MLPLALTLYSPFQGAIQGAFHLHLDVGLQGEVNGQAKVTATP